jgi:hypothetical protein
MSVVAVDEYDSSSSPTWSKLVAAADSRPISDGDGAADPALTDTPAARIVRARWRSGSLELAWESDCSPTERSRRR